MQPLKTIPVEKVLQLVNKYLGIGLGRQNLYHYMRNHKLPKPILPRSRPRKWREDHIREWIKEQIKNSDRR